MNVSMFLSETDVVQFWKHMLIRRLSISSQIHSGNLIQLFLCQTHLYPMDFICSTDVIMQMGFRHGGKMLHHRLE